MAHLQGRIKLTVLVTGGAGYIGSHMVLELLGAGERVVVLDNLSTGRRSAVPSEVELVVGDFGDEALVSDLLASRDVDAIIHFAAKIVVPDSVADPLGYYLNNTASARSLLACAVAKNIKHFIFSSTAAVYGEPEQNPVSEDESLKPVSPYGRSKLMVEWMLEDVAHAHDLRYVVLRYFNVAGADPKGRAGQSFPNATHLIKVAAQAALGMRKGMEIYGTDFPTPDGTCLRDYIQVSDLARAHMAALKHLRAGGGNLTANCGYQRGYSVLEVVETVKRVSGVDFDVKISGRRPGDPAAIVAANGKARNVLGWTPIHDNLDEIVRQALAWEKKMMSEQAEALVG